VKPANILHCDDSWKLGDFGIARLPDSTLTDTGQFLGSPSYAAPESLRAGQFTPASDVYALAATLYEAIAGAPPHGEHDMPSVVRKLSEDAIPLQLRCPVAPELADTIMAGLARDPAQRPTAAEFARRLANEPVVAETPAPSPGARQTANRKLRRIAIVSALFAACFLAVAIARTRTSESAPAVHEAKRVDRGKTAKPKPAPSQPAPSVDDQTARDMLRRLERDARREMERVQGKRRRRLAEDRRRGN
jgi:serine/threonine-protein kinase